MSLEQQLEMLATLDPGRRTLPTLIEAWQRLVATIGDYPGSIADEYLNDLGSRSHIQRLLNRAYGEDLTQVLAWALPLVDAADDDFRAKSEPDERGLVWGDHLAPGSWWLRRVPDDDGLRAHFERIGPQMRSKSTD